MSEQPPTPPAGPWPPAPGGPSGPGGPGASGRGQPPASPPPGRNRTGLLLAAGGVIVLLLIVIVVLVASRPATDKTASAAASTTAAPTSIEVPATSDTTPPPSSTPEPAVGGVGDTLDVATGSGPLGSITVTKVRTATRDPDPYASERAKRGRFLIVTVQVKATADGFDISSFDFYVREAGGRHIEEQCCADFGEELESVTLNEGEKTDGVMVFDTRSGRATLVYAPNVDEEPIGE
jgi:hypothetical protein